jgi:protein-S-isoprenylcysteine O-methyltransferase Ste14
VIAAIRTYEQTKAYDLATASFLIGSYIWTASEIASALPSLWGLGLAKAGLDLAFATLVVALLLVRRPPVGKLRGIAPRLTALTGTFASLLFFHAPPAAMSVPGLLLSITLIIVGMSGAIFTLAHLGRQFSIMPEARRLITTGPYSIVRHPLYMFEQIAILGIAIQYEAATSAILFLAQVALQVCRSVYEEQVLTASFPEYAEYRSRTARLIPRFY